MPADFWALTKREFDLKHEAFKRAEDRHRSLVMELASLTNPPKRKSDQNALMRNINALRRYPVKPWLK